MKQTNKVRKYILDNLESGSFNAGSKIPGSRELSELLDVSRPIVQNSLDTLVNEGVLKSFQRKGLYVDEVWKSRCLPKTLHVYTSFDFLPWMCFFQTEMSRLLPELHITNKCVEGAFEILTTAIAQSQRDEFIDLMPILNECYPDMKPFFVERFSSFQVDGKLFALPFLFSPRIITYNKNMLREASCDFPSHDWDWNDFIGMIRKLRKRFSAYQIFPWNIKYHLWMNFVLSAGGTLLDPDSEDPVKIDSEATLLGLHRFCEIRNEILGQKHGNLHISESDYRSTAITMITRQAFGREGEEQFRDYGFVPIPGIGNRNYRSIQATELFAIRRGSIDNVIAVEIIRFLWSEKFQDKLAELKYGIPLRKSSFDKTFTGNTESDKVFKEECRNIQIDYYLRSRPLFDLITKGISQILSQGGDIDAEITCLASTVRNFIRYTR
jgi:ABC-type glycerol-3-phosphate transport system substrate-binding protein